MQSTIKLPLLSIVKDVQTARIINNVVGPVNRLVAMTSVVLRLFIAHIIDNDAEVPPITESLIRCAMSAILTGICVATTETGMQLKTFLT
jgi:hypothetical protein